MEKNRGLMLRATETVRSTPTASLVAPLGIGQTLKGGWAEEAPAMEGGLINELR